MTAAPRDPGHTSISPCPLQNFKVMGGVEREPSLCQFSIFGASSEGRDHLAVATVLFLFLGQHMG